MAEEEQKDTEGRGKAYSRIVLSFCAEWFNTIVTESNAQAQLGFILILVGLNLFQF